MNKHITTILTVATVLVASISLAMFSGSSSYGLHKPTAASGGGQTGSASYTMTSLGGQTAIGRGTSAGFAVDHGFYSASAAALSAIADKDDLLPRVVRLGEIYPNPFNPSATIRFDLPEARRTAVKIYNMKGQLVRTLLEEDAQAGRHSIVWNGQDDRGAHAASGLYLVRMTAGDYVAHRKITLLK